MDAGLIHSTCKCYVSMHVYLVYVIIYLGSLFLENTKSWTTASLISRQRERFVQNSYKI